MAEETTYKIEYAKCVQLCDGAVCDPGRVQVTSQQRLCLPCAGLAEQPARGPRDPARRCPQTAAFKKVSCVAVVSSQVIWLCRRGASTGNVALVYRMASVSYAACIACACALQQMHFVPSNPASYTIALQAASLAQRQLCSAISSSPS